MKAKTKKKDMKSKKGSKKSSLGKTDALDMLTTKDDDGWTLVTGDEDMDNEDHNDDDDEGNHVNFLSSMSKMKDGETKFLHKSDSKRLLDASVGDLIGSGQEISLDALMEGLSDTKQNKKMKAELKNKKKRAEEAKTVKAPADTPEAARAERAAVYSRAKTDVGVWDSVVHGRRSAQRSPLQPPL